MTTPLERALSELPAHLEERTRPLRGTAGAPRFVVYWMRTAVRAHENHALDVAASLARSLGVGLFVYHALSERYPYASDRHHRFILEGARDVSAQLAERGIGYGFHLERPGHRGPHLVTLAREAGVVITEDMPVPPLRGWTEQLAGRAEVPVIVVDTACVVPMRLVKKRPTRAFAFRKDTARLREERIVRRWEDAPAPPDRFVPPLPFTPVALEAADLGALIAECTIDHGVGPVPHTRGGSAAGYARWEAFLDGPIDRYKWDRNDALKDGVSRMSAYLHMGFVSPLSLARDAAARGGDGAEKFLDELLVWRELAHCFCLHEPELHSIEALPPWARETLAAHAGDPRRVLDRETLARGRTGDPLWDAAQRSLLIHGELHNNVRMTWGKAILGWTRDPQAALDTLIDLNHRYALDGRDPCSYGGLLWCLGLFDRPFEPAAPIRGTLRARPTRAHAKRLDVAAYGAKVRRPAVRPGRVAVIGAGIAGLACARTLHDHGVEVTVLDKGRRVGGRANTRRCDGHAFDHGAQYLTAKDPRFARFVRAWIDAGVVARWRFTERDLRGDGAPIEKVRPVGSGAMRAIAEHLARDLDVRLETRVAPWTPRGRHALCDEAGEALGDFDAVVVTAPLAQAAALLEAHPFAARLREGHHAPCWATMIGFDAPVDVDVDVIKTTGLVAWAARDSSKPGRPAGERWVVHASVPYSDAHLEDDADAVAEASLRALGEALGVSLPTVTFLRAHRWRYARVDRAIGEACLWDPEAAIAVAGDGLISARVEAAWTSGVAAAGRILSTA